jgi:hypothetical protein
LYAKNRVKKTRPLYIDNQLTDRGIPTLPGLANTRIVGDF